MTPTDRLLSRIATDLQAILLGSALGVIIGQVMGSM